MKPTTPKRPARRSKRKRPTIPRSCYLPSTATLRRLSVPDDTERLPLFGDYSSRPWTESAEGAATTE